MAADATKLDRDQNLLHWVTGRLGTAPAGSSKLVRNKLMHTFTEPVSSAEPSHNADLPFNEPEATSESGPSDTYNYWYGDHYHDEEGPDGVAVAGVEVDGSRPAEAEAPWLVDHARDKLEAQGVNVRTPYGSTKAVSFETKQEAQGKKDPWGKEGVLNADNNADLDDEQPLNEAGVVTDRMPGFGPKKMYKKAFPIPFYDHEATTEEANEALDQGHRVVAANGEHMQKDLGITLNQPNLLVYGHADTHSPHLDAAQAAYPMVDGLGDKMESKEEADAHKPLNHLIDDFKRGSEPLEAAKVNVWGQPLSKLIPSGFFDRETESMRQADGSKLKSAGIRVDRVSPFPNTAPKVGQ